MFFESQPGGWHSEEHKLGQGQSLEDANRCPRWKKMMCKYHSESWEAAAGPGPWVPPYLPTEDVIQDLSHNHYRYPFKFNLVSGAVIFGRIIV